MYHSLFDGDNTDRIDAEDLPYAVSTHNFIEQLNRLKNKRVGLLTDENSVMPDVVITFDDGHVSNFDIALPLLLERGLNAYLFVTSDFVGQRKHFCTADQLANMAQNGIQIGSHGTSHRFFDDLSDDEAERELRQSMQQLSDQSGQRVESISYPGGRYNQRTLEISRQAGYVQLFGSTIGVLKQKDLSATAPLKRVAIRRNTSLDEFDRIINANMSYYAIYHGLYKSLSAR